VQQRSRPDLAGVVILDHVDELLLLARGDRVVGLEVLLRNGRDERGRVRRRLVRHDTILREDDLGCGSLTSVELKQVSEELVSAQILTLLHVDEHALGVDDFLALLDQSVAHLH